MNFFCRETKFKAGQQLPRFLIFSLLLDSTHEPPAGVFC